MSLDPRLAAAGASQQQDQQQHGDTGIVKNEYPYDTRGDVNNRHTHTAPLPPPPYPPAARVDAYAQSAHHSPHPQPYYHYPAPSAHTHTPQQLGALSSGTLSNQASPQQLAQYQVPLDQDASPHQSGGEGDGQNGDDPKRPRACEACRGLKVRCDQDPAHPEIPCKRCAKAGRPCVITQPSRKRQKKADSRVAELEKKLDALTAALHHQQGGGLAQYGGQAAVAPAAADMVHKGSSTGLSAAAQLQQYGSQALMQSPTMASGGSADPNIRGQKRRRTDGGAQDVPAYDQEPAIHPQLSRGISNLVRNDESLAQGFNEIHQSWAPNTDLKRLLHHQSPEEFVNRINSLINQEMAATIFDRYVTKLLPHLPAIVFPPGTTAEHVFKEKPILYVCILSAASFGTLQPETSKQLAREAVGAIADCVVRNGAKSLELIQAMQVLALWYKPPEQAEQTNFYQIIHMAAVMALDIGLGKRFNPSKARRGFGGPNANFAPGPHKTLPQDSDTLEARRAWLTCYYLCASASMVLRRPNLVRWTNYMKECIEVLESHPDAFPSDKLFCQHVKIQHICEDIGLQFLMDDNTATINITDPKVTYALNVLEAQLKNWKENVPAECRGPGLQFFEHVTSLYLHEIALHFNHNVEDFRLPFTEESLKSVNNTSDTLTQNQMAALEACLKAAHGILDTILSYEMQVVKGLPMLLFFVRCVYAIVILIKMHVAVCTPGSELGKMMQAEDLRVEQYMERLIELFTYVTQSGGSGGLAHAKIVRILTLLREWFGKHKEHVLRGGGEAGAAKPGEEARAPPFEQTPLHLLSQVAATTTGPQRQGGQPRLQTQAQTQESATAGAAAPDWTFDTPTMAGYGRQYRHQALLHTDSRFPVHAQAPAEHLSAADSSPSYPADPQQQQQPFAGMVDPTNANDFAWGSGFEQAMDIALGGVDGLQGGGLDQWFLGESMAPFGLNGGGEMGGQGQGQGGW
ncbi:hypothetical protein LTR08_002255 [Meristemomyces frigidus]|nr:hypothetical protein LTR08_002255 [Meristemomyces frigidus]